MVSAAMSGATIVTMDGPLIIEAGALPPGDPAFYDYVVAASPRLQITVAILQAIASCGAELASLRIDKADALHHLGRPQQARQAFEEALTAAASIPNERTRQSNVNKITKALKQLPNK